MQVTGPMLWPFAMLMVQRLCSIPAWTQAMGALPKNLAELRLALELRFTNVYATLEFLENLAENLADPFPTKYNTLSS